MVDVIVTGVSKYYGGEFGHKALSDISVTAKDGEFLVLLGPSGSGKTTLLRTIAGLEGIDAGEVYLGDRRITDVDPGQRNIGMVFQDYALYPHMTVAGNIGYNMRIRGVARAEIDRRVREVSTMLGIGELIERRPSQLSGGQRQRVALARAITREATVLLMDEPLSNLDAQIREHVRVELKELQRRLGVTTIYVTHDQVEAMVIADRIAVMSNGRIEQIGSPESIYDAPETLFCVRFVGSPKANELRGQLRSVSENVVEFVVGVGQRPSDFAFRILVDRMGSHKIGLQDAIMAFRPEDVDVSDSPLAGLSASLMFIENRGSEKYAIVELPADLKIAQTSADLRLKIEEKSIAAGNNLFSFVPRRVHLFEEATGAHLVTGRCQVNEIIHPVRSKLKGGTKFAGGV